MSIHNDRVAIFDTTLRDGEQAPGFSMDLDQKLRMAKALSRLGVDVIEAGYPAASPGDFDAVQRIAAVADGPAVCGLARAHEKDIKAAADAIAGANRRRVHTFIATSPIHREHKLRMSREEVLKRAVAAVEMAKGLADEVEFSAEDALRTEPEYLAEVFAAVVDAGASVINVPDTVGYATPDEVFEIFSYLSKTIPGADRVTLSAHCHDDLGMAVANSLAAVRGGARQVECTINGIGERAGNCSMEEVVMALKTRAESFGLSTGIDSRQLVPASRLLAGITGNPVPRNKAIVGDNAFAHESGIHQDGMLKESTTYEIMRPEDVGAARTELVLGKHSGRHALAQRVKTMGYSVEGEKLDKLFATFKKLADKKRVVTDQDIESMVLGREVKAEGPWKLENLQVGTGGSDDAMATAGVHLTHEDGTVVQEAATGNGPIDAAFAAMKRAIGIEAELENFTIRSVGAGDDAQGWSDVRLGWKGRSVHGSGVHTDIVMAGTLAYLDALNRIVDLGDNVEAMDQKARRIGV